MVIQIQYCVCEVNCLPHIKGVDGEQLSLETFKL